VSVFCARKSLRLTALRNLDKALHGCWLKNRRRSLPARKAAEKWSEASMISLILNVNVVFGSTWLQGICKKEAAKRSCCRVQENVVRREGGCTVMCRKIFVK